MKDLHLLNTKTIKHADKMVWNDERKCLFRPERSPFGLVYACKDGQVQDYTRPLGIGTSNVFCCMQNPAHAQVANCAEGFRGPWCEQVCGYDMSLCRWDQPIEQGKLLADSMQVLCLSCLTTQASRLASN